MAMASSSPSEQTPSLSVPGLSRRNVTSSSSSTPRPHAGGPLRPDIEPPPKPPRPILQFLAFASISILACIQFLPATHFRHHSDPLRNWIPFDAEPSASSSTDSRSPDEEQPSIILKRDEEAGKIHLFSWENCLDLRMLAVLANSTLSSSRFPENVHFHFFIPDGEDVKLSYYKLKVLFPNSNLDTIEQKEVKEKLSTAIPEGELLWPLLHEIAPLVIPSIYPSWNRFIYISPDTIIKGKVEELLGVDMGHYAIAVAEDCSRRLGDYVKIEVVNAIQRSAAKAWISKKPYDTNACVPDLSVLLLDATKLDKNLIGAILWWSRVLDLANERGKQVNPAIALALYDKYLKLPSAWNLGESVLSKLENETNVLLFDGPKKVCTGDHTLHQRSELGEVWQHYLPAKSDAVLSR